MTPRPTTPEDLAYWEDFEPREVVFAADDPTFNPCPGIITRDGTSDVGAGVVVRVPWVFDEIELTHLANGGTLWLSTWGGLPPHMLEVQERRR